MVVSALSAVEGVGPVTVYREVTSTMSGAASWTYTVNFVSIVGDADEITVWSGKKSQHDEELRTVACGQVMAGLPENPTCSKRCLIRNHACPW